ncbi:ankyrin repeat domain-containing protein [Wolbachia endosymbiont of Bemisia tabaci]|uniref:ankyrin repeat domain-containing protein n=1 Tax=Wolbachia endosymbiont of Bemisia tabaci TaxID=215173 RepID=UPI000D54E926|nr:ankyrin repeat domain-containing protein [Wolbachia endosymbiont of Bemisia tabaci]
MNLDQFKAILGAVSQKDDIIEEIKQELQEKYPDFYQEWESHNFNIDHRIRIHHDNNIVESTTLLHLAIDCECSNIVSLLIENGANINAVKEFEHHGQISEINFSPRPINTISGYSLLYPAIKHCDESLVRSLIDRGADVNVRAADGWTPLHCAAAGVNENIVSFLIQNNANINDRVLSKRWFTGTENF